MVKFEEGKVYQARSVFDQNCIFTVRVVRRTAKTVTAFVSGTVGAKTLRVGVRDGVEFVKPLGSYSMAPIVRAQ